MSAYRFDDTLMRSGEALHPKSIMFFLEATAASAGDPREESSFDSETSLPLTALALEDAIYKGEGNANIVIALPDVSRSNHIFFLFCFPIVCHGCTYGYLFNIL